MNNHRLKINTYLVLLFAVCFQYGVLGDTLVLNNGDRISGTLQGIAKEIVEFKTDYAGMLHIKQDNVVNIKTDSAFLQIADDGRRIERAFDATIAVSSVHMARNDTVFGLGKDAKLEHSIDLSGSYSFGNSSTQVYLLSTESQLTRPKSEHILKSSLHYDTAEGEPLKNQLNLNYKTRKFFRDKWFYALNADAYRDTLKSLDLRLSPTLGMGYRFWDHTYGKLTGEAGVAMIIETLDDLKEKYPALSWELDYSKRFLGGRLEAFHTHRLLSTSADGFVLDSSNGLKYSLVENVNLNLLANLKHDTNVPEDVKKTDVTYVAGMGLTF